MLPDLFRYLRLILVSLYFSPPRPPGRRYGRIGRGGGGKWEVLRVFSPTNVYLNWFFFCGTRLSFIKLKECNLVFFFLIFVIYVFVICPPFVGWILLSITFNTITVYMMIQQTITVHITMMIKLFQCKNDRVLHLTWRRSGLMVSALVPGLSSPGLSLPKDIVSCFWAGH